MIDKIKSKIIKLKNDNNTIVNYVKIFKDNNTVKEIYNNNEEFKKMSETKRNIND